MPLPVGETNYVEFPLSQPKIGFVGSRHCGRSVERDRGRRQRYELDAARGQLSLPFVYRTAVALPRKIQDGDLMSRFGKRRCHRKAERADTAVAMRASELAGSNTNAQAAGRSDRHVVNGKAWESRPYGRAKVLRIHHSSDLDRILPAARRRTLSRVKANPRMTCGLRRGQSAAARAHAAASTWLW
jgi:hypothetical protein